MTLVCYFGSEAQESETPLKGLERCVEVEARPTIAIYSCCSLLRQWKGCANPLAALSHLPYMSYCASSPWQW